MNKPTSNKISDPVRTLLRERDCPEHLIEAGLPGLLDQWEEFVASVEEGYALTLDDYLNDLDVRQLLHAALSVALPEQAKVINDRLLLVDDQFKSLTKATEGCLWSDEVAAEEDWTPKENWWYYRRPKQGDRDFLAELAEALSDGE